MVSTTRQPSSRARHFWQRMCEWYGSRFADQFGLQPSPDWCVVIDGTSNSAMKLALGEIKRRHAIHPPTLPEFDAIASRQSRGESAGPSMSDRLAAHVLKHRSLTAHQCRSPWTYHTQNGQTYAVDVPADGDVPGFRVRSDDLLNEQGA